MLLKDVYKENGTCKAVKYDDTDNDWATSNARTWCNGEFLAALTAADANAGGAIKKVSITEDRSQTVTVNRVSYRESFYKSTAALKESGDSVFFLSAEEYEQYNGSVSKAQKIAAASDYWWLRSRSTAPDYSTGGVGGVYPDGRVYGDDVNETSGARPALYLDSDLFESNPDYTEGGNEPKWVVNPTSSEDPSVAAVEALIKALPAADKVTTGDADDINAAKDAYDELTDAQKALVADDLVQKLTDDIAALKDAEDTAAANVVKELIKDLPSGDDLNNLTDDQKEAINNANDAYNNLTDDQKAKISDDEKAKLEAAVLAKAKDVAKAELAEARAAKPDDNYDAEGIAALDQAVVDGNAAIDAAADTEAVQKALAAAKAALNAVPATEKDKADKAAADAVTDEINKLPAADKVTTGDKDAIEKARQDYDALTDDQKKLIDADTLKKLTDDEAALKNAKEAEARKSQVGTDGTALGAGAPLEAAEAAILGMTSDADPAGSRINPLKLRSKRQTKKSVKLTWNGAGGAVKYVIYGNKCNAKGVKYKMTKLGETSSRTFNVKKIKGKKLAKGRYHKFIVVAVDANNNVVSTSKVIHVATKGGKYKNYSSVRVSNAKKFKKLKAGKSLKIKAKAVGSRVRKHVGLRYESSNPAVATVTAKGKVKAVSSGTAIITVYAQNGKYKNVKVVVK